MYIFNFQITLRKFFLSRILNFPTSTKSKMQFQLFTFRLHLISQAFLSAFTKLLSISKKIFQLFTLWASLNVQFHITHYISQANTTFFNYSYICNHYMCSRGTGTVVSKNFCEKSHALGLNMKRFTKWTTTFNRCSIKFVHKKKSITVKFFTKRIYLFAWIH